jgi:hypothetical protein
MFLSKTSKIRENTFDLLHLTLVFPGANGVVGLFVSVIGVVVDEEFRIIVFR